MEKIVSLCKRRGFIYQSSEIYGGINGFWDYGPLGAELKRNVKDLWWREMVRLRDDVVGLEATIIMHPQIWKASGHVDTFSDPMCDCLASGKRFRADQVDPQSGKVFTYFGAVSAYVLNLLRADYFKIGTPQFPGSEVYAANLKAGLEAFPEMIEPTFDKKEIAIKDINHPAQSLTFLMRAFDERAVAIDAERFAKNGFCTDRFEVLVSSGGNESKARIKTAREFYQRRGNLEPVVFLLPTVREETNSTRYNPENGSQLTEPRPFNLMFKTFIGASEPAEEAYLRPETAQAIFAQFKNVLETSRQKVPFGIAQVGKAFRNEVTPRNFTFRSREFEQMELEFFIKPDEAIEATIGRVAKASDVAIGDSGSTIADSQSNWGWEAWHKYWVEERIRFYESIGLPRRTLVEYWQKPEELAHYARATVDILYKFPFSKRDAQGELMGEELEGIAARSDFDLSQHERFSGKPMGVFDEEVRTAWNKLDDGKKKELWQRYYDARLKYLTKVGVPTERAEKDAKEDADGLAKGQYIPHVIEPSAGVDRLILALICNAFAEMNDPDEKGKSETRVIMRFHPRVAPIKVAVLPLLKNKPDLVSRAHGIYDDLRQHMMAFYDDAGSIGRRYARQDEAGTPFCVTVDFETLEGVKEGALAGQKDTVTIRYRGNTDEENGKQERIPIAALRDWLLERIR